MYTKTDFWFSKLGNTLILNFPYREGAEAFQFILQLTTVLKTKFKTQLEDATLSFNSINLFFKEEFDPHKVHKQIFGTMDSLKIEKNKKSNLWKLPVCLAKEFTSDLFDYFNEDQQQVKRYLEAFMKQEFSLFFYGFLPGFPYLSGLPEELMIPRKKTPNRLTLRGSLAVGASQVGIYPQDSPGGWHVLGNCPISLINFEKSPPNFIQGGDRIQFFEISKEEHQGVLTAIKEKRNHPLIDQASND